MQRHDKRVQWLYGELPHLVEEGVIDSATAASLKRRYGPIDERDPQKLLFAALATLGSLLVGLGIVLLFAYNWDSLPRWGKTALAFAPLVLATAFAERALRRHSESAAWTESTSLALGIAAGACIGLVSQTYQISGDLESFYAAWMWVSLPLLFAFRARSIFLLLALTICLWAPLGYGDAPLGRIATFLAVSGSCLALLLRERRSGPRPFMFLAYAVSSCFGVFGMIADQAAFAWPSWVGALLATIYLWERAYPDSSDDWKGRFTGAIASLGLVGLCLALSFKEVWTWMEQPEPPGAASEFAAAAIGLILFVCYCALLTRRWRRSGWVGVGWAAAPVAVAAGNALAIGGQGGDVAAAIVMNVYLLGTAIAVGAWGYGARNAWRMNQGLLAIVALAAARFFDSDLGMLARGAGFVAVGAGFLAANFLLAKRRKEASDG